jgi:hypothetical protein
MQGNINHGARHYRCKFTAERAPVPGLDHPKNVYIRESAIVPKLDEWIASLFAPKNVEQTCRTISAAAAPSDTDPAKGMAAERKLTDCDKRLNQYRKALGSGADPAVVAGWMTEVQAERLKAEQDLAASRPSVKFTPEQVRSLVESLGDLAAVLEDADPRFKSQLCDELGISVRYDPTTRTVSAWATVSVGGGTHSVTTRQAQQPWHMELAA